MRITFLTPHIGISGGIKIVFEYANRLQILGHNVTVVSKLKHPDRHTLSANGAFMGEIGDNPVKWFDLQTKCILAPSFEPNFFPDSDVIIATAWQTAFTVDELPPSKGKKFYLVQSYETWDGPKEEVDKTWVLPLRKIVVASWLKELAMNKFGQDSSDILTNGVDFDSFYSFLMDLMSFFIFFIFSF